MTLKQYFLKKIICVGSPRRRQSKSTKQTKINTFRASQSKRNGATTKYITQAPHFAPMKTKRQYTQLCKQDTRNRNIGCDHIIFFLLHLYSSAARCVPSVSSLWLLGNNVIKKLLRLQWISLLVFFFCCCWCCALLLLLLVALLIPSRVEFFHLHSN